MKPSSAVEERGGEDEEEAQHLLQGQERTSLQFQDFTKGYQSRGGNSELGKSLASRAESSCRGYRALDDMMDEIGEGRFHHAMLVLMCLADFVESTEVALHGILLPFLQEEFNLTTPAELALVGSLTGLGMMLGSTVFAIVSNRFGRKSSFMVSLLCSAMMSFVSSYCDTLVGFALARFGLGFGYGGNMVSSTTLLTELTPSSIRARYMNATNICYALGAIFSIGLAWGIVPLVGFRWLLRIVSFLAVPVLVIMPLCPESPRFLIMRGRYDEALAVLQYIARVNKIELKPTPADLLVMMEEMPPLASVMSLSKLAHSWKSTVPLFFVWFLHSFSCGLFGFVPLEVGKLDPGEVDATYKIAFVFGTGALFGTMVLFWLIPVFGRLPLLRVGLVLTGVLTAVMGIPVGSTAYVYGVGFFVACFSVFPISMLYLYTPEVHPTETRTIGFGICMLGHRLAPVASPFAAAALMQVGFPASCLTFGLMFVLSGLVALFLRIETFGRNMVESDDLEEVGLKVM